MNFDANEYIILTKKFWFEILNWGSSYMRDYPWRTNPEAYNILIAEILLHRTRADQVKPIYKSFIKKFPNIESIVNAGPEQISSELRSLGLYWRSDLIYFMAKEIKEKYQGEIPVDKYRLMQLKGIGQYISSAVPCFGYDIPEPILDTNTVRVIGRFFGMKVTDSSRRSKKFENIMRDIISYGEPRKFSLSLIDFASLVCTPRANPKCNQCPLKDKCNYYKLKISEREIDEDYD